MTRYFVALSHTLQWCEITSARRCAAQAIQQLLYESITLYCLSIDNNYCQTTKNDHDVGAADCGNQVAKPLIMTSVMFLVIDMMINNDEHDKNAQLAARINTNHFTYVYLCEHTHIYRGLPARQKSSPEYCGMIRIDCLCLFILYVAAITVTDTALKRCSDFAAHYGKSRFLQQSYASYLHVCIQLLLHSQPLVFGLGRDSEIYLAMNSRTVFVENDNQWILRIRHLLACKNCTLRHTYTTRIVSMDSIAPYENASAIPDILLPRLHNDDANFDFILIDAPAGYDVGLPGRFEPVKYASAMLKKGSLRYVCMHDYQRAIENALFREYFGEPTDVIAAPSTSNLACATFNAKSV
jgi:hypothetical protein